MSQSIVRADSVSAFDLTVDELDNVSGGVRLGFRGFELEFDGTQIGNGLSRIASDAYQYLFPNAASNQVADAQQQREIRDAMSDLQQNTPMTMPMGDAQSQGPIMPSTSPDTTGYGPMANQDAWGPVGNGGVAGAESFGANGSVSGAESFGAMNASYDSYGAMDAYANNYGAMDTYGGSSSEYSEYV